MAAASHLRYHEAIIGIRPWGRGGRASVRVVDPVTLEDATPGEKGELWFRSAQSMRGYLNKPEASAAAKTADGWIRSGDIGRTDDGLCFVVSKFIATT